MVNQFNKDMLAEMLLSAGQNMQGSGSIGAALGRGFSGAGATMLAKKKESQQDAIYRQLLGGTGLDMNIPENMTVTPDLMKTVVDLQTSKTKLEDAQKDRDLKSRYYDILEGRPAGSAMFGGSKDPYLTATEYLLNNGTITQEEANAELIKWRLNRQNDPTYKGDVKFSEQTGTNKANILTGGEAEYAKQSGQNRSDLEYEYPIKKQSALGSGLYTETPNGITPIKGSKTYIENKTNVDKSTQNADYMIKAIDAVLADEAGIKSSTGGFLGLQGAQAEKLPLSDSQRNFKAKLDQIKGKTFMQAYETLKGGGQITEIEGRKGTDAIARLQQSQTPEEFKAALKELKDVVNTGKNRTKNIYSNMEVGGSLPLPPAYEPINNSSGNSNVSPKVLKLLKKRGYR